MDGLDFTEDGSHTDTDLAILQTGVVTTTPLIPMISESSPVQTRSEIEYSLLDNLPTRDVVFEEEEYTVVSEQNTSPDCKIFGFRRKGDTTDQTKLFQIVPSSHHNLKKEDILYKIDFSNEETLKTLIREGEKIVEHAKEVASKLRNTPVPLNDSKSYIHIGKHSFVLMYQSPESSEHIESAFHNTLRRLNERFNLKQK